MRRIVSALLLCGFQTVACPWHLLAEPSSTERLPVILIPGILGSKLIDRTTGEIVWGQSVFNLANMQRLRLPEDPARNPLTPGDLVESVPLLGPFKFQAYGPLIQQLEEWGFRKNKDLFLFSYDWRKSNFDSARSLEEFVRERTPLREGRFRILAHSMGGLVAWIFAHQSSFGAQVDRVITLGTPFLGSVAALEILSEGLGPIANPVAGGQLVVREAAFSFPSLFEMLPSYENCCLLGPQSDIPKSSLDLQDSKVWAQFRWLPPGWEGSAPSAVRQRYLASKAALDRLAGSDLPNTTKSHHFAGRGRSTPAQAYFSKDATRIEQLQSRLFGDGDVIALSAARGHIEEAEVALTLHRTLFEDDHVRQKIKELLGAETGQLRPFAGQEYPPLEVRGRVRRVTGILLELEDSYGVRGEPFSWSFAVVDDGGQQICCIVLSASLVSASSAPFAVEISEEEHEEGCLYRARIPRLPASGTYAARVAVQNLGVFEDYLQVVEGEAAP